MTYGNGAYVTYQYWSSGQLSKISHYDASDTLFYSMAYEYDKAGNVTKLTYDDSLENNGDGYIDYKYDDLHRLTKEQFFPAQGSSRGAYKLEYWYDAVGNRTKFRRTDKWYTNRIEVYDYSPRNELTRYSYPEGYGRYRYLEYDMRGNRTKSSWSAWPDQWSTYEWDSHDRLTKVYNNWNSKTIYYKYDLMGRRVAKKINDGDWNWYFYDGLQVIAEGKDTDDRTTYTLAPSASGIGILPMNTGGTPVPRWYHYDRLGNVMGVTDENGDVVRVYNNTAFSYFFHAYEGDGYDNNVSDVQPYHLTTKEWDADIGLYYFNARWYDKNTGRFVSRTPVPVEYEHPYSYCANAPTRYFDPEGLKEELKPPLPIDNPKKVDTCCTKEHVKKQEVAIRARMGDVKDTIEHYTQYGMPPQGAGGAVAITICLFMDKPRMTWLLKKGKPTWGSDKSCLNHCALVHEITHMKQCINLGYVVYTQLADFNPAQLEIPAYQVELACLEKLLADAGLKP